MIKVYHTLKTEKISLTVDEFCALPDDLNGYTVGYVGKHITYNLVPGAKLSPQDLDFSPELLIECRLFNKDKEIYIFPRKGKIFQRVIEAGETETKFVEKKIQLRNEEGFAGVDNDVLVVRHYLDVNSVGYSMVRYIDVKLKMANK